MLRHVRIGAHDDDAEVGKMCAGGPDFLAIDNPVIAISLGPCAQRGEIGATGRFAEQLAPNFFTTQCRFDVAVKLFRFGIGHHGRDAHAEANFKQTAWHGEIFLFLVIDDLEDGRQLPPTETFLPGDAGEPGVGLFCLPGFATLHFLGGHAAKAQSGSPRGFRFGVGFEEGAGLGAEGGFFGAVVEVHDFGFLQAALRVSIRSTRRFFQNGAPPRRSANCFDLR